MNLRHIQKIQPELYQINIRPPEEKNRLQQQSDVPNLNSNISLPPTSHIKWVDSDDTISSDHVDPGTFQRLLPRRNKIFNCKPVHNKQSKVTYKQPVFTRQENINNHQKYFRSTEQLKTEQICAQQTPLVSHQQKYRRLNEHLIPKLQSRLDQTQNHIHTIQQRFARRNILNHDREQQLLGLFNLKETELLRKDKEIEVCLRKIQNLQTQNEVKRQQIQIIRLQEERNSRINNLIKQNEHLSTIQIQKTTMTQESQNEFNHFQQILPTNISKYHFDDDNYTEINELTKFNNKLMQNESLSPLSVRVD